MRPRSAAYMFLEDPVIRSTVLVETTEMFVSDPVVRRFVADDRSSFDLVLVESFFQECTVALGHKYGAPVVRIVPVTPWASVSRWAANPSDFAYVKDFILDGGKRLRFWERVTNAYIGLYGLLAEPVVYLPRMQAMMDAHFRYPGHERRPAMVDMLRNVSLALIDSDVMILSPRPYVPSFVEVPGIHMRPGEKMDEVTKKRTALLRRTKTLRRAYCPPPPPGRSAGDRLRYDFTVTCHRSLEVMTARRIFTSETSQEG